MLILFFKNVLKILNFEKSAKTSNLTLKRKQFCTPRAGKSKTREISIHLLKGSTSTEQTKQKKGHGFEQ
jgi:hypothetical protein